jgi:hypothetical protein
MPNIGNVPGNPEANKIDNQATDGLLGVEDSLAYKVAEIEQHIHSEERWYGSDGDGTGSTANNLTEFQVTAGTGGAYGTEVQILGANDVSASDFSFTPAKFDLHRLLITAPSVNDKNYMLQLWCGTTTFGAASLCTEVPYRTGSNNAEVAPIELQMSRENVAVKVWARCKCETDAATLDFLAGIHAYPG